MFWPLGDLSVLPVLHQAALPETLILDMIDTGRCSLYFAYMQANG